MLVKLTPGDFPRSVVVVDVDIVVVVAAVCIEISVTFAANKFAFKIKCWLEKRFMSRCKYRKFGNAK
jgi:hypothetical protein